MLIGSYAREACRACLRHAQLRAGIPAVGRG